MTRLALAALAGALIGVALTATNATAMHAAAIPPTIVDLRVLGGEAEWHPVNEFRLDWDRAADGTAVAAVHFRVRDEAGEIVVPATGTEGEIEIPGDVETILHIRVPAHPGLYRAEVWLEGSGGGLGPIATADLRFDDLAPGPARPIAPSAWIAAGAAAVVRIAHPSAPLPLSGIRGYAVSVDRGEVRMPCAGATRCTLEETDLHRGVDDDTISLGILPEGLSFARAVAVSGSGTRSRVLESTPLWVDATYPEVLLRGAPAAWSAGPVRLTASASDALSGMAAKGAEGPYTAIALDGRAPTLAAGDSVTVTVGGEGTHLAAFYARDAAGNVADGEAGAPAPGRAYVRIDETAPKVAFAVAQDPSEPERIEATVTDALSGPDPGRGTIAIRPAGSSQPFETLPTATSAGGLVAHWDSERYPTGVYELRATGYDLAGNASVGDRRLSGQRMTLSNPLKETTGIVSGFLASRARERTVPYGRGTAYGGQLTSASGTPLGDLPVSVTEVFAAGAGPSRRETVVRTHVDGSFLLHLPAGPSRRVEVSFAGDRLRTRSNGRAAELAVRSSVRLRSSAAMARVGGAPIAFAGRIGRLGASIPAAGLSVELQFRLPGSTWTEFRTVRTDAAGRFRYSYGFSDDDSRGVRFQFRAFVPRQAGWPYEPAGSRPVLVTGR
jgi:hypothetical protein